MIQLTSAQLETWLALFVYPFVRILSLLGSSPLLGNKQIPNRVKIGLAGILAIIIAPTIPDIPRVAVGSAQGLFIIAQQILIGVAMGFSMRLIFSAVEMAGEFAGLQMGLGFASFYDPINASHSAVISQWLSIFATLIFLALDGHYYILTALAESFHTLPIGQILSSQGAYSVASWGGSIFSHALQLSLPILAALLTTNIALGILTRAAPQLNLFAIGFPITLTIGFLVLSITLPYFVPHIEHFMHEALNVMLKLK